MLREALVYQAAYMSFISSQIRSGEIGVTQKLLICHLHFNLCICSKVVCLEYNIQISIALKYFIILSVHFLLTNYFKQDKDHGSKWG